MALVHLNLAALRRGGAPSPPGWDPCLSRRALLALSGAAAAARGAVRFEGDFALRRDGEAVELCLGGQTARRIDPRDYSGRPRLRLEQSQDRIAIRLSGARYPGCDLPADFEAELSRRGNRWFASVRMPLADGAAEGPLEPWLAGDQDLRLPAHLDHVVCRLGQGELRVGGQAELRLAGDGGLVLRGERLACLLLDGAELPADGLALALPGPEEPSLLDPAPRRRTALALARGGHAWPLQPVLQGHAWRLEADPQSFDTAVIEAAPGQAAVRFEGGGRPLEFRADGLGDFGLEVTDPTYATAFGSGGRQAVLTGLCGGLAATIESGGCAVTVRGGDRPFEATARDGCIESLRCEAELAAVRLPLDGALVEAAVPSGQTLTFVEDRAEAGGHQVRLAAAPALVGASAARPPIVRQEPGGPVVQRPPVLQLALQDLTVTRPDDLLRLTFSFHNLRFVATPNRHLERVDTGKAAHIVVHFPPQHVAEEAFPEPPYTAPSKAPPVAAMLSGGSRLAFYLPADVPTVDWTLAALLDWKRWRPSLAPVALPNYRPRVVRADLGGITVRPGVVRIDPQERSQLPIDLDPSGPITSLTRAEAAEVNQQTLRRLQQRRPGSRLGKPNARLVVFDPVDITAVQVDPTLIARIRPEIAEPTETTTALELPYRLMISPNVSAGWAHALEPVTLSGRTELWHTRLGVLGQDGVVNELDHWLRTIRCIWTPDYTTGSLLGMPPEPYMMPMERRDRVKLVRETSDFTIQGYTPRAVPTSRLMLSSLGGWLTCRGTFNAPFDKVPDLDLSEWVQQTMMGRDQFVKLVQEGFVFPFGHRCIKTTISERKVVQQQGYASVAYLRKRMFLTVLEPTRSYPASEMPFGGRDLPFRSVEIITDSTPDLDYPIPDPQQLIGLGQDCFWPTVGGKDFQWLCAGEDWDGERIEFTAPLVWIAAGHAVQRLPNNPAAEPSRKLVTEYEKQANAARRDRPLHGQQVALAPSAEPGDGVVELDGVTFGAGAANGVLGAKVPRFYPRMIQAKLRHPAVKQIVGDAGAVAVKYFQPYLAGGFGPADANDIFCDLAAGAQAVPVKLAGQRSGVATPGVAISGLSRNHGPIGGDPAQLHGGGFDPVAFLGNGVKMLGGITLAEVIQAIFDGGKQVPRLTYGFEYGNPAEPNTPTAVAAQYTWKPKLQNGPAGTNLFDTKGGQATFSLVTTLRQALEPGAEPSVQVDGELKNFSLRLISGLFDLAAVHFTSFTFTGGTGKEFDCRPRIADIEFLGPLAFLEKLLAMVGGLFEGQDTGGGGGGGTKSSGGGAGGFSIQPILDIDPVHIAAGASMQLPTLAVGVFSLQNIKITGFVDVPFMGDPVALHFRFCERQSPFLLTVTIFGGGGFFGMVVDTEGVREIEASLEFGACFCLNLGVASGEVHAMGGVYFKWQNDECTLTGYVRLGGSLNILGLISVSLEFNLSLTYESAGNRAYGQASLTVHIEILFFETSVSVSVEKQFAGEKKTAWLPAAERPFRYAGLPRLGEEPARPDGTAVAAPAWELGGIMDRTAWDAYCDKFAA